MKKQRQKFGGSYTANIEQKNKGAAKRVKIFAYIFGVIGLFIFGGGMSIALVHADKTVSLIVGSIVGISGIAMLVSNSFLYQTILQKKLYKMEMEEVNAELEASRKERNNGK